MTRQPEPPRVVKFLTHVRDVYVPWVESHLLIIALGALGLALLYALVRHLWHGRHKVSRPRIPQRRVKSPPTTAAQRNLELKLRSRVGHADDVVNFIDWPADVSTPGAVLVVRYAPGWSGVRMQVNLIHELVEQMCGGTWRPSHDHRHNKLRFIRQAPPLELPKRFEYPDTGEVDKIPIAVSTAGEVIINLKSQSPHILIAGTTGGGKTTTASVIIAHMAARGGLVSICDPKMVGYQQNFEGLHNVQVSVPDPDDDVAAMIEMVDEFYRDMRSRYAYIREHKSRELPGSFPTRVLVIDEMGSFVLMIKEDWEIHRPRGAANRPPTLDKLRKILFQGRFSRTIVVCAVQHANATAIGGSGSSDMREMYGMRISCGAPGDHGGDMLFGSSDIPQINTIHGEEVAGRGLVSRDGGDVMPVQLADITQDRARQIAARGAARFGVVTIETDDDPTRARALARVDLPLQAVTGVTTREPVTPTLVLTPVTLTCLKCNQPFETNAAGGTLVRCKNVTCKHPRRVPVGARSS